MPEPPSGPSCAKPSRRGEAWVWRPQTPGARRSANEYLEFMRQAPQIEQMIVRSGVRLFKYWVSVTREEQKRRF